jgi:hypothetical protein
VVVGETRDQAAHAGTLIEVEYAVDPPVVFSPPIARDAVVPPQRMWRSCRRAATPGNCERRPPLS